MINIVLVGAKNKNGMRLLKNLERVIQTIEKKVKIKVLTNSDKNSYGIKNVPALILDGKIISQGKVLSEREVHKLLMSC